MGRSYDALLLDLDGTLLDSGGRLRDDNVRALRAASAAGVKVLVVTGRSKEGTERVLAELGLPEPAVVVNGGGLVCPRTGRMLEERVLSNETRDRALAWARSREHQALVMATGRKLALAPRDEVEAEALVGLESVELLEEGELTLDYAVRVTVFSRVHEDSRALSDELERAVARPVYMTHFPLHILPEHRSSRLVVADVHPPCRGKAEALRVLRERYGIPPERAVAVGDATNDLPMIQAAGLGVAMANSMSEVFPHADRVIGSNDTDAIAGLVEELFLGVRGVA